MGPRRGGGAGAERFCFVLLCFVCGSFITHDTTHSRTKCKTLRCALPIRLFLSVCSFSLKRTSLTAFFFLSRRWLFHTMHA
ncbi:hypothetical protein B0T24DRAFT_404597 [Lasiosphaeria ovina]|uniref:Uncharacterized protein n=1 Tax=Lasiosphaeria ovina TaxID=92902 RepID=A0AAE0JXR3_9PEZI|nr:hypothetical protein B0T24DRAFT_404597 [Lasiosphaeria ovina]